MVKLKIWPTILLKIVLANVKLQNLRSRSAILYRKVKDIKICAAMLGDSPQVALKHYQDEVGVAEIREAAFPGE